MKLLVKSVLNLVLGGWLLGCATAQEVKGPGMRPLDLQPNMATVGKLYARAHNGPSDKSPQWSFFVWGAADYVCANQEDEQNGWLPVNVPGRNYEGKVRMRRTDLVFASDLKPWDRPWPLAFVFFHLFESEGGERFVMVFPPNNRCTAPISPETIAQIRGEIARELKGDASFLTANRFQCKELWHAPGTNIFYPNPSGGDFAWWDEKNQDLRFYSDSGLFVYGYRDGRTSFIAIGGEE